MAISTLYDQVTKAQSVGANASGDEEAALVVSNSLQVSLGTQLANERNPGSSNQYGVGVPECNYFVWGHADGDVQITTSPALLFGFIITGTLTGTFALRDGTTGTDPRVYSSTALAVPTVVNLPGIKMDSGIFIDDAATGGAVVVLWRLQ